MYVIVWEFQVRKGSEREFEGLYGPGGEWSRLFGRADGFLGLELLREGSGGGRYLVVDRWASRGAFEAFRDQFLTEYEALDRRCDSILEHEAPLGVFLGLGRTKE